ncbi:MAG: hypothetical protein WCJ42_09175 [Actinomycetes bacterium]
MSRRRVSPSTFIAVVATIVAISSTSAIASAYITGGMIKTRTITAGNIAKNTLTGVEINESKLGTVPSATTAAKLAGLPYTSYLRSNRVQSGVIDFSTVANGTYGWVFTDSRMGIRVGWSPNGVAFQNTNAAASIWVEGTGWAFSTVPHATGPTQVLPGAYTKYSWDAIGGFYVNFLVERTGPTAATSQAMFVTCMLIDAAGAPRFACVGVG